VLPPFTIQKPSGNLTRRENKKYKSKSVARQKKKRTKTFNHEAEELSKTLKSWLINFNDNKVDDNNSIISNNNNKNNNKRVDKGGTAVVIRDMTSYNNKILDLFTVKCKLCGEEATEKNHLMSHCAALKSKQIKNRTGTDEERRRKLIRDRLYELGSFFDPGI